MQSTNRMAVPHTIRAPISSRKPRSMARPGANSNEFVVAHHGRQRQQQQVADQQAVDRLAHHHGVLPDIDQEQQHQLAGEQHRRAGRRDDSERQRDIEAAGEIGLEKMHHPERAKECADAQPPAGAKQRREHDEVDEGVGRQEEQVCEFGHRDTRSLHFRAHGTVPTDYRQTVKIRPVASVGTAATRGTRSACGFPRQSCTQGESTMRRRVSPGAGREEPCKPAPPAS